MGTILKILSIFGGGLCHQKIERTFSIDAFNMPVCSRCTGIYTGIFLSLLVIVLLERKIKGELPSLKIILTAVGIFLLMGAEVVLSMLGLIESGNIIRLATGLLTGWFMALLLFPLANNVMFGKFIKENYLSSRKKFLIWVLSGIAIIIIFIFTYKYTFIFWSIISILGLVIFTALILFILFFSLNKRLLGSIDSMKKYIIVVVIGLFSSSVLLLLFSYLKRFLI